jgi:arabinofuranosyltransferase
MPARSTLAKVTLVLLALGIWLRWAWVSDDAYITLRTVDHLVSGHGPRYNLGERVAAFTHPLWMLLLAPPYALLRDAWLSAVLLGLLYQLSALGGLLWSARGTWAGLVAASALMTSRAAADYATSGLENPLEALLLVAIMAGVHRPWLIALLGLTRLDALLLVAPLVALELWRAPARPWGRLLLAASPLLAWHLFALGYYGSLLPNTALAKLGAGIPASELHLQAWRYLAWTARHDPVTLLVLAGGVLSALRSGEASQRAWALGLGLHLAWLAHIGGDFMGGRFLVVPLWVAALLLARVPWTAHSAAPALGLLALSVLLPCSPLRLFAQGVRAESQDGIVDERAFYEEGTSLSAWWAGRLHPFALDGQAARSLRQSTKATIGLYGFYAGPRHHVIDKLGLADPLLARLPAELPGRWRIGHFRRDLPAGYEESIAYGRNLIPEPGARRLYDDVRLATRAPLLEPARLGAIVRLHLGDYPLLPWRWRWPEMEWVEPDVDLEVGPDGLGLRTRGLQGVLDLTLSRGEWTLYLLRGDRVEVVRARGEARIELRGVDRVVCFAGAGRGTLAAVHRTR